jgi:hypothetical protein
VVSKFERRRGAICVAGLRRVVVDCKMKEKLKLI